MQRDTRDGASSGLGMTRRRDSLKLLIHVRYSMKDSFAEGRSMSEHKRRIGRGNIISFFLKRRRQMSLVVVKTTGNNHGYQIQYAAFPDPPRRLFSAHLFHQWRLAYFDRCVVASLFLFAILLARLQNKFLCIMYM